MAATPTARRRVLEFRNVAILSVGIVVAVLSLWAATAGWPPLPWPIFLRSLAFGPVLGLTIGGLSYLMIPFVASRVWPWHPVLRGVLLLATMVVCAVVGTLTAATVPYLVGLVRSETILVIFRENIRGTIPVTVIVGVVLTLFGAVAQRLQATELALRTQQLDRERAEKLAAEAQLASLASRVHPHFLFNTLNSISALVRDHPVEAERTIERLASLLRSSLESADTVPLERELKLVTDYLEIQRTRLGDRLRYDVRVEPDAAGSVPPFAVQSVVENSLKHVAGHREQGVAVQVHARRVDGALVVDVTDDGPGFDQDAMRAGHGLDTLQSRLRTLYGGQAGLEFLREPGGMTVRLRLPAA